MGGTIRRSIRPTTRSSSAEARRRVLFTRDTTTARDSWLVRAYIPGLVRLSPPDQTLEQTLERLGGGRIEAVPIPA